MKLSLHEEFEGILYGTKDTKKAIICISGSDGGIGCAKQIARTLSHQGITTLALAYWGTKRTSKTLSEIPIERIQSAVHWIKKQGYQTIGIYGISKGAELALVAASLIPEIHLVIAVSPACCVFEGIAKPNYSGHSSWTWRGKELPYASFQNIQVHMVSDLLKNHQFGFKKEYIQVLKKEKTEENTIKVENINGPILLLSAREDAQWPSRMMGELICHRLYKKGFKYPYHHEIYSPASHILCPVQTKLSKIYRVERKYPRECKEARKNALRLTVQWIRFVMTMKQTSTE